MKLGFWLSLFVVMGQLQAKPLKVFILAGQSNMEGHAKVETFDYIGDDPASAGPYPRTTADLENFALMGRAFAEATLQMMRPQSTAP
ncbi:hypothetical protein BH11VER1_BH11VER1_24070 [soil metagenome]